MGGGSNSVPNPSKTVANRNKKEAKDRKAKEAGKMTRAEVRASKREQDH